MPKENAQRKCLKKMLKEKKKSNAVNLKNKKPSIKNYESARQK